MPNREQPSDADASGADPTAEPASWRATAQPPLPAIRPSEPDHYRIFPSTPLPEGDIRLGWAPIAAAFASALRRGGTVVIDGVAGVLWDRVRPDLMRALASIAADVLDEIVWLDIRAAYLNDPDLDRALAPYLTEDPVFGRRHLGTLADLMDRDLLAAIRDRAAAHGDGATPCIVLGPGAALAVEQDGAADVFLAWIDVPKNEVQYRSRAGAARNLGASEPAGRKEMYKRFYFVDWILTGRHVERILPKIDLMIDGQRPDTPASVTGKTLRSGLHALTGTAFRARPWFEPGVWGGSWLRRQIPELPEDVPNYAWSFELIAPENGVLLEAGGRLLEVPFEMLMYQESARVLGRHAQRFGTEFPIRFDFLDTVEGENLSLQCHPSPEFIGEHFGEPFTQDETYYILDAESQAEVYLGFCDGVDPAAFREAVERSARTGTEVDVPAFVQVHPARKHDLFLIPHGTVHCSGAGTMVLEISATPYIFTFKIYDWLRLDLDGRPRPLNIERAFDNLDFSRQGPAVPRDLIARPEVIATGPGYEVEHLPTHQHHFYDVHRVTVAGEIEISTDGSCHVLSLVEGERVMLQTDAGERRFWCAETIVVPAAVGTYRLRSETGEQVRVVKAFLK